MASRVTDPITDNLRAEMARRRRSQGELAEVWGVSDMAVSRRMNGFTPITAQQLVAAADWLGVDVSVLLEQPQAESA